MRGIATKTLFLVVVIGMIIFFSLVIFWHWLGLQIKVVSRTTCAAKLWNYCNRWYNEKKEPGDWDNLSPKDEDCRAIEGLEDFGKPDEKKCKDLIGRWYK